MACRNAVGKFIPPMGVFKRQEFHSEFAEGFPDGSFVTITDSGWVNEK
jgi:hypothetical protein